jgi:superfamily II DNA or RNA helicase
MAATWRVGDRVRARGDEWRIDHVATGEDCIALTLAGAGRANVGRLLVLLAPFDRLQRVTSIATPRWTRFQSWLRAARTLVTTTGTFPTLRAASSARILLLPHQLAPALAMIAGVGCRFLLADAVGLGKTIQAGLMLAELRARGEATRCLILTPVGLRDQWAAELADRFGLTAHVVDRAFVRAQQARYPQTVNPWRLGDIAIASIDYAKRPDVLPGLSRIWWDLLIVDEAHAAALSTERGHLVNTIGVRARRVVLLTATPHAGEPAPFASLCRSGALGAEPVVMFRRTKREAGLEVARHVRLLAVAPTAAERHMHDLLARYTRLAQKQAVPAARADAWLALVVLNKRALSSAHSLAVSVARRMQLLSTERGDAPDLHQMALDFDAPGDGDADEADAEPVALGAPALTDAAQERDILAALYEAAMQASAAESKFDAIRRLIRRAGEPAIVFTEYRDTLRSLAAGLDARNVVLLHGGLSRRDRQAAEQAFVSGPARVLLATDAAGEGLNLQARGRLVINLELPWSPRRLEQRIGRVDRIGQRRTVHAVHLFARDTGESRVLARLVHRLQQVRATLDDIDRQTLPGDAELLGRMVEEERRDRPESEVRRPVSAPPGEAPSEYLRVVDFRDRAEAEARRLEEIRRVRRGAVATVELSDQDCAWWRMALDRRAPWVATTRRNHFRARPSSSGVLCIYRLALTRGGGHIVEETLLPIWLPFQAAYAHECASTGASGRARAALRRQLHELFREHRAAIQSALVAYVHWRAEEAGGARTTAIQLLRQREQDMLAWAEARSDLSMMFAQQGLFDRRAVRAAERRAADRALDRATAAHRALALDTDSLDVVFPREPALVLIAPPDGVIA